MYHLATLFPPLRRVGRLPLSRDQLMLLMAAINELLLGVETYLGHRISGTVVPNEWIPVVFGPLAGILLLLAGVIALRRRSLATAIGAVVLVSSIIVGLLGAYFHLRRGILPSGPAGEQITLPLLVWAPPILAPLTFALVGVLGLSAAAIEDPVDSGRLVLWGQRRLTMPLGKTQAYFVLVGLGCLATVISSVFDHVRSGFENPWLWVPTAVGVFATVVAIALGTLRRPTRPELLTYAAAMALMLLTGPVGMVLHIDADLVGSGQIVWERFIRGAPILAPMLFSDMGLLGVIVLLDPSREGAG